MSKGVKYNIKPATAEETKPVTPETAPVNLADECPLCHQFETVSVHTKDDDGNRLKNIRCQRTGCGYIARFKNGKMV